MTLPGHRYRSRIERAPGGHYVLILVGPNGCGGASAHATQDEALAAIPALYATITSRQPPTRGEAVDGPRGRQPGVH